MAIDPNNVNTIRVGELVPDSFSLTDNIPHEVGTDLRRGTIQEFVNFIAPLLSAVQFEVKVLHVDQTYIDDNFDITGLGTNLMLGYAICNGNNGTINKAGRVGVAYGGAFNIIGATGGSATHTLLTSEMPAHHHHKDSTPFKSFVGGGTDIGGAKTTNGGFDAVAGNVEIGIGNFGSGEYQPGGDALEQDRGGNQPHNNMQPYLVELHVMKL